MTSWRSFIAIICAFSAGSAAWAQDAAPAPVPASAVAAPQAAAASIQIPAPVFEYGRIAAGTVRNHSYNVTNAGTAPLLITSIFPLCGCTTVLDFPAKLEPGQTGAISIRFDSTGFDGQTTKEMVVASNDPEQPEVTLSVDGTVYTSITVTPTDAVFSSLLDAPVTETKVIRITNNTDVPLTLSKPESTHSAFVAELVTIDPGKEFDLRVTAVPPFGAVGARGLINLQTNSAERPVLTLTTLVVVQKPIIVSPSGIWPPLPPGNQSRVSIRNNSGLTGFALSDPAVNLPGVTAAVKELEAGKVFSVTLTFPEGFQLPAGTQGELTVKTNNPRHPLVTVPIRPNPRRRVKKGGKSRLRVSHQ